MMIPTGWCQCELYWHPQQGQMTLFAPTKTYHLSCRPHTVTHLFVWLQRHGWHFVALWPLASPPGGWGYRFQRYAAAASGFPNPAEG